MDTDGRPRHLFGHELAEYVYKTYRPPRRSLFKARKALLEQNRQSDAAWQKTRQEADEALDVHDRALWRGAHDTWMTLLIQRTTLVMQLGVIDDTLMKQRLATHPTRAAGMGKARESPNLTRPRAEAHLAVILEREHVQRLHPTWKDPKVKHGVWERMKNAPDAPSKRTITRIFAKPDSETEKSMAVLGKNHPIVKSLMTIRSAPR